MSFPILSYDYTTIFQHLNLSILPPPLQQQSTLEMSAYVVLLYVSLRPHLNYDKSQLE